MAGLLPAALSWTIWQLFWTLSLSLPLQPASRTSLMGKMTSPCTASGIAIYNVTMETFWSADKFPKQYPTFRPHAQWSRLIGRTHSAGYRLWSEGHLATAAVKLFTTTKDASEFDLESQGHRNIFDMFSAPRITTGVGMTSSDVYVDAAHPLVSLIIHMIPSPDWFVGLDHVSLCSGSEWLDHVEQDLRIWDAGVDKGFTFTAPNWPEVPQVPITEITSQYPNHVASSLFYEHLESLPIIARATITRENGGEAMSSGSSGSLAQNPPPRDWGRPMGERGGSKERPLTGGYDKNDVVSKEHSKAEAPPRDAPSVPRGENGPGSGSLVARRPGMSSGAVGKKSSSVPVGVPARPDVTSVEKEEVITKEEKRRRRREKKRSKKSKKSKKNKKSKKRDVGSIRTDTDCQVSEWSVWSACSKTCGYGNRQRTRRVNVPNTGSGSKCPPLAEEEMCGSMRGCGWSHFSQSNWGNP